MYHRMRMLSALAAAVTLGAGLPASAWEAPAGNYDVRFGASVEDIRATAAYKLKKVQTWPVNDLFQLNVPLQEITVSRK